jgi:hypothetical protein
MAVVASDYLEKIIVKLKTLIIVHSKTGVGKSVGFCGVSRMA